MSTSRPGSCPAPRTASIAPSAIGSFAAQTSGVSGQRRSRPVSWSLRLVPLPLAVNERRDSISGDAATARLMPRLRADAATWPWRRRLRAGDWRSETPLRRHGEVRRDVVPGALVIGRELAEERWELLARAGRTRDSSRLSNILPP